MKNHLDTQRASINERKNIVCFKFDYFEKCSFLHHLTMSRSNIFIHSKYPCNFETKKYHATFPSQMCYVTHIWVDIPQQILPFKANILVHCFIQRAAELFEHCSKISMDCIKMRIISSIF